MSLAARAVSLVSLTLSLGAAGCCFGGGTTSAPVTPPGFPPAITPTAVAPGAAPAAAVAATTPQTLALGAGFAPDPTTVTVVAGGDVSGSTMGAADGWCAGNYPAAAQINLALGAALPNLRVVGRAENDTTMAIRFPDGHVECNDDGAGYPNPAIDITNAAPGAYQIYIGSFGGSGQGSASTVAITTNLALQPTQY